MYSYVFSAIVISLHLTILSSAILNRHNSAWAREGNDGVIWKKKLKEEGEETGRE
jgi:hypothetical protein